MGKKSIIIALFLSIMVFAAEAFEPPSKPAGYVTDLANVFTPNGKSILIYKLDHLATKTEYKPQVVVLTVPSLGETPIFTAATDTFKKWKLGSKNKDNGVLILLDRETKQFRVEIGFGIEQYMTTTHLNEWFADIKKEIEADNYDAAVNALVAHMTPVFAAIKEEPKTSNVGRILITLFAIIISIIILVFMVSRRVSRRVFNTTQNSGKPYDPRTDPRFANVRSNVISNSISRTPTAYTPTSTKSSVLDTIDAAALGYIAGSLMSGSTSDNNSSTPSFKGGGGGETSGGGYSSDSYSSSSSSDSSSDSGGGGGD